MQVANERPEAMQRPVAVVFVADPDAQHLLFKTQPARAKLNPKSKVNQKDFKVHSEGKPRCVSWFSEPCMKRVTPACKYTLKLFAFLALSFWLLFRSPTDDLRCRRTEAAWYGAERRCCHRRPCLTQELLAPCLQIMLALCLHMSGACTV